MPSFYAFINVAKAKKSGLEPDKIYSPYDLWNGLPRDAYRMFNYSSNPRLREVTESSEEFRELERNPEYVKRIVSCGN